MRTMSSLSLDLSGDQLNELYASSPVGEIPTGWGKGTAVYHAGSRAAKPLAALTRVALWQGKQFRSESHDLVNLVTPFSLKALPAEVYEGESWYDGRPCMVIDYSKTSKSARRVRDEIRQVGPGEYLGIVFLDRRRLRVHFFLRFAA